MVTPRTARHEQRSGVFDDLNRGRVIGALGPDLRGGEAESPAKRRGVDTARNPHGDVDVGVRRYSGVRRRTS